MARDAFHPLYPGGQDPALVCMAGDLHGNTIALRRAVEKAAGWTSLLIQLGDFGYWCPGRRRSTTSVQFTSSSNSSDMVLCWVDGNHEDHDTLQRIQRDKQTRLRRITDRIWHLPRGYRWSWGSTTWMALGGAVSVDQQLRTPGLSWWPQEQLTDAEVEQISESGPVDVIVAHDVPQGVAIPAITPASDAFWPRQVIAEANEHRRKVREVVDRVRPSRYWHGHYHCRYSNQLVLDPSGPLLRVVEVQGIADDSTPWRENVALADTAGNLIPCLEEGQ